MSKITVSGADLHNACSNALLFTAPKSSDRSTLTYAKVTWTGSELLFEATDSYALIRETVPGSGPADALPPVFVPRKSLAAAAGIAKKGRSTASVSIDGDTIAVSSGGSQVAVPLNSYGAWPASDQLFASFVTAPEAVVGIGASQYARLGKIKSAEASTGPTGIMLRWECGGASKPSRFSLANIVGLVMPVRLPS